MTIINQNEVCQFAYLCRYSDVDFHKLHGPIRYSQINPVWYKLIL
jgi:hypothetical protein